MNARAHAEVIRALLADVNSRAAKIEAELNDLRVEQRGLELSLARLTAEAAEDDDRRGAQHVQVSDPVVPPGQPLRFLSREEEWRMLGKTAAVKRVLAEAAEPLGPSDVMVVLESVGLPQEDSEVVRGALAYLKRKGEATSVGRSQWVLIGGAVHQRLQQEEGDLTSQDADAASVSAEAASVPVHPIMNGGDASGTDFDRDHDDTSSGQANHRVHGHGAPVGAPN